MLGQSSTSPSSLGHVKKEGVEAGRAEVLKRFTSFSQTTPASTQPASLNQTPTSTLSNAESLDAPDSDLEDGEIAENKQVLQPISRATPDGNRKRSLGESAPVEQPPAKRACNSPPAPDGPQVDIYKPNERKRKACDSIDADVTQSSRKARKDVDEAGLFIKKHEVSPVTAPADLLDNTGGKKSKPKVFKAVSVKTEETSHLVEEIPVMETPIPSSKPLQHEPNKDHNDAPPSIAGALNNIDQSTENFHAAPPSVDKTDGIGNYDRSIDHACSGDSLFDTDSSSPLSFCSDDSAISIPEAFKDDSCISKSSPLKATSDVPPVNNSHNRPNGDADSDFWYHRGLMNGRNACFQNSILQCLHQLPLIRNLFQSLDSQPDECILDNILSEEELYLCALRTLPMAKRSEADRVAACKEALSIHLEERYENGQLGLSRHLTSVFLEMSARDETPINKYLLQQVCGYSLENYMICDKKTVNYFDGESQEDAAEFLRQLLVRLDSESGGMGSADQYMQATIRTRRSCKNCGREKEMNETTHIHEANYKAAKSRKLEDLAASLFPLTRDDVRFRTVRCDHCGSARSAYKDIEDWERARVVNPNQYLVFNVSRGGKATITPTVDDIEVPAVSDGQFFTARYRLQAVTMYGGSGDRGHYTALRRHRGEWYLCDDDQVSKLSLYSDEGVIRKLRYGRVFFYERVD